MGLNPSDALMKDSAGIALEERKRGPNFLPVGPLCR